MQKKFLTNVLLVLVLNVLIKPFWVLGIDRMVQNQVGNEAYGVYINLFSLSLFFVMILDFGINNYTTTTIAANPLRVHDNLSTMFTGKIVLSIVYLAATLFFGLVYGLSGEKLELLFLLCINQIIAYFILFFRASISGLQRFKTDSFLSVGDKSAMIIIAIFGFYLFQHSFSISHYIYVQLLGYILALLLAIFALRNELFNTKLTFNLQQLKQVFTSAAPYALLALVMTVYTRSDYLLMNKWRVDGDIQNGIYAVANRLQEAGNMMAVLVAGLLLPLFSNLIAHKSDLTSLIKTANNLLLIPGILVAVIAWFYHEPVIFMLNDTDPASSAPVFKYTMISFAAMCMMYIYGTLLTAMKKMNILIGLALLAVCINIGLNYWAIPRYGAVGAAAVAALTHSFIAFTNMYFGVKLSASTFSHSYWLKLLTTLAIGSVVIGFASFFQINVIVATATGVTVSILMMMFLRLFNLQELPLLFKANR